MYRKVKVFAAFLLVLISCFTAITFAMADSASDVLSLVNEERSAAGLKTVKLNENLNRVAELRAAELAENWSHTRPNGEEWKTAFSDAGVKASYRGENLGKGQSSADQVVDEWMASEGHKENILNKKFTSMGVASVVIDGTTYWVQVFANEVKTTKTTSSSKKATTASSEPQAQSAPAASSGSAPAAAPAAEPAPASSANSKKVPEAFANTVLDIEAAMKKPAGTPVYEASSGL